MERREYLKGRERESKEDMGSYVKTNQWDPVFNKMIHCPLLDLSDLLHLL